MKLASLSIDQRTRTAIVDPEQMQCWPLNKAGVVCAISDVAGGWIPQFDSGDALKFTREQLLAPISAPLHNIMCVGKNYRAHAQEFHRSGFDATADSDIPAEPIVFTKPSSSIFGPYDDIPVWPVLDESVDYEAELAVVIGRGGRMISRGYGSCIRLHNRQRLHRLRSAAQAQAMVPRQRRRWVLPDGTLDCFYRRDRSEYDAYHLPRKWRITPERNRGGPDLRYTHADRSAIEGIGSIVNRVKRVMMTEKQVSA